MKKVVLTILVLVTALTALAQATQPCVVKQYNQKQQKTPLSGVQVEVRDAQSATSAANGAVTLQFATLKPGDRVTVRRITKPGYEIFNKAVIDQWTITRGATTEIVLVQSSYFTQLKSKLTQSSTDNYKKKYEQAKAELAQLQKAGKLKEAEYRQQLNDLEDQYDNALKNLDNYIDQFARIDLSEVSAEEQRILDMVQAGQIDEAVKAYEALDISGKLRQARENKKALSEAKARIEEEEAQQEQTIKDLKEKQQREIATLKLAGGKENYDKVARILKENALADTTDIDAIFEYATFAAAQNLYEDAENFYLKALDKYIYLVNHNPEKYLAYYVATLSDLGLLNFKLNQYDKAEDLYLNALEKATQLSNSKAYHFTLTMLQNNLGLLYSEMLKFGKSEECFFKALESATQLYNQYPETYSLGCLVQTYANLGQLYHTLKDYDKSESFNLKALEYHTQIIDQDSTDYEYIADQASLLDNLGGLYKDLGNYEKAEDCYLKALENRTRLFNHNPDAYLEHLAKTQNNLGGLYKDLGNYEKAEDCYLKALENKTRLFNHNPDAYREDLTHTQLALGQLYEKIENYSKSVEFYHKSLENYSLLLIYNPSAFQDIICAIQYKLGGLYSNLENFDKAEEYYLKVQEYYTPLFIRDPSVYCSYMALIQDSLGILYHKTGNTLKAIENELKMEQLFNNYPDTCRSYLATTQHHIGNLYAFTENYTKAEEFYLKTLENYTQLFVKEHDDFYLRKIADVQQDLSWVYDKIEDNDKEIEYTIKAVQNFTLLFNKNPDTCRENLFELLYSLALSYAINDDYLKAIEAIKRARELHMDNDHSFLIISRILERSNYRGTRLLSQGKIDEALMLFENGYQVDPRKDATYLVSGYNAKAYEYAKAKDFTKAIETIDRAIELMPEDADYYDTKGEILLMNGDEQEAVKMWQKVLELDPDFLKKYEGGTDFYKQLKEKGLIND